MKLGLYNLISEVHNEGYINNTLQNFLNEIEERLEEEFENIELKNFNKEYFPIIFIKSGGVERKFKDIFENAPGPFFLLTSGLHNSFAAALEISSFLRQTGKETEIFHGNPEYIARRIKMLRRIFEVKSKLSLIRLGVIGKPSGWLIASKADYGKIKEVLGISLVDIEMQELAREIDRNDLHFEHSKLKEIRKKEFDNKSIEGALKIYNGFKAIVNKYKLDGITVKCFDLIKIYSNTGCLGLSLLNDEGIVAGCEGDIPALISMVILHYLTGQPVFMANPSSVNIEKNEAIFAHCTLPLNMPENYFLKTHFESGLGVGIRGEITTGEATIFKLSGDGEQFFISGGEIIENLNSENLCRTQIRLRIDEDVNYFLHNSIGNHHLICTGNHSEIVKEFLKPDRGTVLCQEIKRRE